MAQPDNWSITLGKGPATRRLPRKAASSARFSGTSGLAAHRWCRGSHSQPYGALATLWLWKRYLPLPERDLEGATQAPAAALNATFAPVVNNNNAPLRPSTKSEEAAETKRGVVALSKTVLWEKLTLLYRTRFPGHTFVLCRLA